MAKCTDCSHQGIMITMGQASDLANLQRFMVCGIQSCSGYYRLHLPNYKWKEIEEGQKKYQSYSISAKKVINTYSRKDK